MDPLSITASAIAVVTLATKTCNAFVKLRRATHSVPGRVHAIGNEVSDTLAVVSDVVTLLEERNRLRLHLDPAHSCLPDVLAQLKLRLGEVKLAVETLEQKCVETRIALVRLREWSRAQDRLQGLQEAIKHQKGRLNVALGAVNSCVLPS